MKQKGVLFAIQGRILFAVTVGIFPLPVPGVTAHIHEGLFGLPAQNLCTLGRIGIAGGDVTGTAVNDLVGQLQTVGLVEGLDHIQHGIANAGAQIEHFTALVFVNILNGCNMALSQVHHMDVIPHTGAVMGVIVIAVYTQELTAAHSNLGDVGNRLALRQVLESLSDRDRSLIELRYFRRKTQQHTAEVLGMTQVQVSRRERAILRELRRQLTS